MNARPFVLSALLIAFTLYTAAVVAGHGFLGFVELALAEAWVRQMLIDLVIVLGLFALWMFPDARARGLPALPYAIAIATLGSIGALAYLLHRELAAERRRPVAS